MLDRRETQLRKPRGDAVIAAFQARIDDAAFPCVGAKSAQARGKIEFAIGGALDRPDHDRELVQQIQRFAQASGEDAVFTSLALLFPDSTPMSEFEFEAALWQRLQAFHDIDAHTHAWDGSVSADPASSGFSMSLGGRGFYVVGLHPGASREARRFQCATLVFNLHSQFEALRGDGRYGKLRDAIVTRDVNYSGSRNPMLADHGQVSEARQYSGRRVEAGWRCPFAAQASGSVRGA